ncbi:PA4642 family protein [Alcanivorax sp. JB21]|uniref:PA4642 family protein n=1 Tax=Alcanivorax limicola TaxID=2874102 RepID=UPI001CBC6129|nr:PA4642 family protein [Alcanivorax limicola]MBZ2189881.1 PA4642 family protein [Alcanivorax limicola]
MSERKDKKKVIGEPMTDEQIRAFLGGQPESGLNADFHLLQRAYRSLREEDFDRFLDIFTDAGGNVSATDPAGRTLADIIANHAQSAGYLDILKRRLQ